MFVLDYPYVSDFLIDSIRKLGLPVLNTDNGRSVSGDDDLNYVDEIEFSARMGLGTRIYTNSENGLEHVLRCRCNEDLARQIDICKDKALFRETIQPLHPEYRFARVSIDDLAEFDASGFECPFIVKPARGFFSLGVHVVKSHEAWSDVVQAIHDERAALNAEYPEEVVNSGEFIVEAGIEGEEYAIDAYYDADGTPVITNILHHHFMDEDDISDRLYYTSVKVMNDWLAPFTDYMTRMGEVCGLRNFCTHVEVRVTENGDIIPIEANPLRFAGWCVADITNHAWGINPYEYYFNELKPDWDEILGRREGEVTAMIIGDVAPGIDRDRIENVDYAGFQSMLGNVLELRKIDYLSYPVFAFCFARMDEAGLTQLKSDLKADFSRFITVGA